MNSAPLLKPVILSADDDEDAHILLRRAFAKAGTNARLLHVYDGSEAVDYLAGKGKFSDREQYPFPDLLLLDLKMPTPGEHVLEYLRSQPAHKPRCIIVFSSSSHPPDVEKARALGCNDYFVKPESFQLLIELVKELTADMLAPDGAKRTNRFSLKSRPPELSPNPTTTVNNPKSSEPAQPQSPDIFKLLVEQVKDYAIFMLDPGGIIRSWNEGARRIKGYEANEIIGKHFSIFYSLSDIEADKPGYELRMAQEMGRYEEQGWRVRKDKARFWADVVITPLRNEQGELQGYAKVTRDLTQTKLQEESFQRLLESEERFRLLVEQVKDYAIFMLDARGNVISWNQGARRIKGYSADEIIGRHFSTFYTDEALKSDHPTKELTIAIRDGRYEEEGWRKRKDGTRFWANVVITALWDKRGNLSGFAKVTRDLTQRKREQDALKEKNEALEAFAHTLSHDLRAPLRSISSFAEILSGEVKELSEEEKQVYLRKIKNSANSVNTMITDVLRLSQVTVGPAPEQMVSLEDVVAESLRLLETEIQNRKADIQIERPLPGVFGNRTLLVQVFSNLLANALKFVAPGQKPRVTICARMTDGHCELHVQDHGIGIPWEMHEKIFNVFDRGSVGDNIVGMGIGLAIVRKAVERLGGSISVQSRPGEGSDFIVRLRCRSVEFHTADQTA